MKFAACAASEARACARMKYCASKAQIEVKCCLYRAAGTFHARRALHGRRLLYVSRRRNTSLKKARRSVLFSGADGQNRTDNLLITRTYLSVFVCVYMEMKCANTVEIYAFSEHSRLSQINAHYHKVKKKGLQKTKCVVERSVHT